MIRKAECQRRRDYVDMAAHRPFWVTPCSRPVTERCRHASRARPRPRPTGARSRRAGTPSWAVPRRSPAVTIARGTVAAVPPCPPRARNPVLHPLNGDRSTLSGVPLQRAVSGTVTQRVFGTSAAKGAGRTGLPQRQRLSSNLRRVASCITLFEAYSAFTARNDLNARQVPYRPSALQASAASSPPRPLQLLPAGTTVARW